MSSPSRSTIMPGTVEQAVSTVEQAIHNSKRTVRFEVDRAPPPPPADPHPRRSSTLSNPRRRSASADFQPPTLRRERRRLSDRMVQSQPISTPTPSHQIDDSFITFSSFDLNTTFAIPKQISEGDEEIQDLVIPNTESLEAMVKDRSKKEEQLQKRSSPEGEVEDAMREVEPPLPASAQGMIEHYSSPAYRPSPLERRAAATFNRQFDSPIVERHHAPTYELPTPANDQAGLQPFSTTTAQGSPMPKRASGAGILGGHGQIEPQMRGAVSSAMVGESPMELMQSMDLSPFGTEVLADASPATKASSSVVLAESADQIDLELAALSRELDLLLATGDTSTAAPEFAALVQASEDVVTLNETHKIIDEGPARVLLNFHVTTVPEPLHFTLDREALLAQSPLIRDLLAKDPSTPAIYLDAPYRGDNLVTYPVAAFEAINTWLLTHEFPATYENPSTGPHGENWGENERGAKGRFSEAKWVLGNVWHLGTLIGIENLPDAALEAHNKVYQGV